MPVSVLSVADDRTKIVHRVGIAQNPSKGADFDGLITISLGAIRLNAGA